MRTFNDEEVHEIQKLARSHGFDVLMEYLRENYQASLVTLVDENSELVRGEAIGLRALIKSLTEAVNFVPTEFDPVTENKFPQGVY